MGRVGSTDPRKIIENATVLYSRMHRKSLSTTRSNSKYQKVDISSLG